MDMIKNADEYDCIYKWTAKSEFDMLKNDNMQSDSKEAAILKCVRNAQYFDDLANAMPELIEIVEACISEFTENSKEE